MYSAQLNFVERKTQFPLNQDNPLVIGHDVWIGQNVTITPTCKSVGDGAIVAAGAVVTKDVEPFAIVDGVSAKFLKWRFPVEIQEKWIESKWWDKSMKKLEDLFELFLSDATRGLTSELCERLKSK